MTDKMDVKERTQSLISTDRLADLRSYADMINSYCVFTSLYVISNELNGNSPPRLNTIKSEFAKYDDSNYGEVDIDNIFQIIQPFCERLNIKIKKILLAPNFANSINFPDEMKGKVVEVTPHTQIEVEIPCMQVFGDDKTMASHLHAEALDDSEISKARIKKVKEMGWLNAMFVEFEKA